MTQPVLNASSGHNLEKPVSDEIRNRAEAQFDVHNKQFASDAESVMVRKKNLVDKKDAFDNAHQMKDK